MRQGQARNRSAGLWRGVDEGGRGYLIAALVQGGDEGLLALVMMLGGLAAWVWLGPGPVEWRLGWLARTREPSDLARAARMVAGWCRAFGERRRAPVIWRGAVIELCDGIAAELRAGRAPEAAFTATLKVLPPQVARVLLDEWKPGLEAPGPQAEGALDVAGVQARVADRPGAEGLRLLAASWRIGAERGGAFATVVEGLAAALRDEESQRREIAAQLAGPRATARLLASLPLLGLVMAVALGARPLEFLLGTFPGFICLLLGTALNGLGLWWTRRIAEAAQLNR